MENSVPRKIIHIDMDAFYASVEQRDHPFYRNKAIAVGGFPKGRGGVVAAASYEARKFGIHAAMPAKRALQLCPDIIFVKPRFDAYKAVSQHLQQIFARYTDLVEPLALDEAYLDVTKDKLNIGSAIEIAKQIKKAIWEELQLTASAGVSINKFIAKIASDLNKPDGLTFIAPAEVDAFMAQLPVEKFYGVGKVTADKMKKMGLFTGADVRKLSEEALKLNYGKLGTFFFKIVRGIDDREVQPNREKKSLGAEDTFPYDLVEVADLEVELEKIAKIVYDRLLTYNLKWRTITLKIKYSNFKQITRNQSFPNPVGEDYDMIFNTAKQLLVAAKQDKQPVQLLGITLSNFGDTWHHNAKPGQSGQLSLFDKE